MSLYNKILDKIMEITTVVGFISLVILLICLIVHIIKL